MKSFRQFVLYLSCHLLVWACPLLVMCGRVSLHVPLLDHLATHGTLHVIVGHMLGNVVLLELPLGNKCGPTLGALVVAFIAMLPHVS